MSVSLDKKSSIEIAAWPVFEEDEIQAATDVLRSGKVNYWTGQEGKLFEKEFAKYIGCNYAVAVSNGTVALELALEALDITAGDEVIVPSASFIATASSVVMRGAKPICADITPYTQNISAETILPLITPKTKAIICVHLGGIPCDMDPIMELANTHNLRVIEDCAQAHGAVYKGRKVGSIGHINAFSFCQDKIMTTGGEGGMVTTNDKALWRRAWSFKDHGKDYDLVFNTEHPPGFRWLHTSFGTNWRMTEMQSAIGRKQLEKLEFWNQRRTENAYVLINALNDVNGIILPEIQANSRPAWYKFYAFVDSDKLGMSRDELMSKINDAGVKCMSGSCKEMYKEKAFEKFPDVHQNSLANAQKIDSQSLMFMVHHTIPINTMKHIAQTLREQLVY